MKLWIARDEDYTLYVFNSKPEYNVKSGQWECDEDIDSWEYLPKDMFPEVVFENSPKLFADNIHDILDDDTIEVEYMVDGSFKRRR